MPKIAVILSGCGHADGAEIRESVLTLLALDRAGATVQCFAPNIPQMHVVNHLTGQEVPNQSRNVLEESARIARGKIKDLNEARATDFDALILPGGYGAAKNLSDLAINGAGATVLPALQSLILDFVNAKKPIGAICISPAVLTAAVKGHLHPNVTLGTDDDGLIKALGSTHTDCTAAQSCWDSEHKIATTPAYMLDAPLAEIATGIDKVIRHVLDACKAG